jgi:hypothetical protein
MGKLVRWGAVAIMYACAGGGAHAQVVQGWLELQWGDPVPADTAAAKAWAVQVDRAPLFHAGLVTDRGERIALDPAHARRAAGDLYALTGRRVAVAFSREKMAGTAVRGIEAIVPADDIDNQRAHPLVGKVDAVPKAQAGSKRWLTLACRFSDITIEQKTIAFFRGQYGDETGRLGHYWRDVSHGRIDLAGSDAKGWYALPHPRSHYVTKGDDDKDKADLGALFRDCTQAADADVDYDVIFGINMMFNGDLDGYAWGGSHCAMLDGRQRCFPSTWNPPWSFENLAPLAHEMGHGYGLPHSDNSDGDDDPYDNPWDVMSDGWSNAVRDATYGTRPKHINILQRDRLGWVDAARKRTQAPLEGDEVVRVHLDYASIAAAQSSNIQMLVLQAPEAPDPYNGNFYTVEARRRAAADGQSHPYEGALAGDAVIIHRVGAGYSFEAQSQDADRPPADVANNEGSMFKVGEGWVSPDGLFHLQVESQTPTGFLVRIGRPRLTGGHLPAQRL